MQNITHFLQKRACASSPATDGPSAGAAAEARRPNARTAGTIRAPRPKPVIPVVSTFAAIARPITRVAWSCDNVVMAFDNVVMLRDNDETARDKTQTERDKTQTERDKT